MHTNILSRTRNEKWVPSRISTTKHSTYDRLECILSRSLIFGYAQLAYNTQDVLLLKEIREDLVYEIEDIRKSSIREMGVYESPNDGKEVDAEYIGNVLAICDMMVCNTKSALDIDVSMYVKDNFYRAVVEYYNMVYGKFEGEQTIESIEVSLKVLERCGMSIKSCDYPPSKPNAVVVLDSTKHDKSDRKPNIIEFMACTTFVNATTDCYMAWLACMCIEPDANMMVGGRTNPLPFIRKWFTPMCIDEAIHTLANGCSLKEAIKITPYMNFVIGFLTELRKRQNMGLGMCTNLVLKSALGASNYMDRHIVYLIETLTGKNAPSNVDDEMSVEGLEEFKSSDMYSSELDITSGEFTQVAAPEDPPDEEDPEEDPEEPEEDPDTPEEEPEEDPEEDPAEDPDSIPEDEPTDLKEEDEQEKTPKQVSETSDKKGIELSVQEGDGTLDEYLYRKEIGFILTKLLDNPPEKMSAEKLAILKDIKNKWLYIFDVKTIHATLSKIVDLKIKIKTTEVA